MATVYLRFYEELNDFLPLQRRKIKFAHQYNGRESVKDLIESLGIPHSEIDLILVNGNSVKFDYLVKDNDEISVYPVFESFDISNVTRLRPAPLREPKFIADVHLGTLARYLRMLGIDTLYSNGYSKDDLVRISLEEGRAVLTKDRSLLKKNDITHGYWIRNENPVEQVREVIERFDLANTLNEFSRCMDCNGLLAKVEKPQVEEELPEKVKLYHNEFYRCPSCRKIYWKGTHFERMKNLIEMIKKP